MIEMKSITKSFGTNLVLDNVNLNLHKGEILALLGENGAGKSTLMNILGEVSATDERQIARHMVGHDVRYEVLTRDIHYGEEVLRVEKLSNEKNFKDVSFSVRKGEILGVTGLMGDGRSELFLTLFGDMPEYSGNIYIKDKLIKIDNIQSALKHNIGYLPRNRKENAIIKDLDILENGTIVSIRDFISRLFFINKDKQLSAFDVEKKRLNVKMGSTRDLIGSLSGGNQQKIVLLKWLLSKPDLLILDNPTQGVDVGSKEEIYDIIHELSNEGVAIIVLSNEVNEIIRICDRTLVMYHGQIMGECQGESLNENDVMYLATGGKLLQDVLGK